MNEITFQSDTTIAAIATPLSVGGISIIRISGEDSIKIADRVFRAQSGVLLKDKKGYTASYGAVFHNNKEIDTSVAVVYRAPKSYTGEDVVELSCHGGIYVTREVLRAVLENGAVMAQAGEFTKRAFLNGKLSLTQAEAVVDMINSQNKQALNAAKAQLDGALFQKIKKVQQDLLNIAGHLAAWVDYPEEDIPVVEEDNLNNSLQVANNTIHELLKTYDTGKIFKEGIETVIVGKPNVGKSTLMNLLVGSQKSIVTDIAGTTRDIIEETVMLGDIMLKLADTAGIRETDDTVEQFGVEIAKKRMDQANLVLAVFDASEPLTQEDREIMLGVNEKLCIAIVNKTDLPNVLDIEEIKQYFKHVILMSAKNADSIHELDTMITDELHLNEVDTSAGMLANERQRECAIRAQQYLQESIDALAYGMTLDAVTVSIEMAIDALLELTGGRITTALVDQVFSHFCVGK
ncbi:tRNA uridine-5-carboxymethylaminomethyl(34) synthesis GTPase MnmE [Paludicola sp. MB14-C6]|uniref:tRNA uridine-5-carboxymethylaminomethyl(34) synthesis GTPase MnmE n=1 Tax=Paludihabitans sp. MB14-C6 TaxID=3070656 RepID=UPI0027DDB73A|nr:tRNA uridine-5-carboxymethylaminomethyl(34) synthesis GTPase MnmE [Paludicola sp. MB14-C6]WMJ21782.1 tRNA uridine-5-carboxymethylaminomethyl(34) synthesis GTPase MnmE [Paludicola sp. MB14-C6]